MLSVKEPQYQGDTKLKPRGELIDHIFKHSHWINFGGIYSIICEANGKRYVGASGNIRRRISDHRLQLSYGKHANKDLQADYNKFGSKNFFFEVHELIKDRKQRLEAEKKFIGNLSDLGKAYNLFSNKNITPVSGWELRGNKYVQTILFISAPKRISFSVNRRNKDESNSALRKKKTIKNRVLNKHPTSVDTLQWLQSKCCAMVV